MATKKWYETWWGLLWTLAIVDAHPGRGVRVFMELDKELSELPEFKSEESVCEPARPEASHGITPYQETASVKG